jgi:hypothetical protein
MIKLRTDVLSLSSVNFVYRMTVRFHFETLKLSLIQHCWGLWASADMNRNLTVAGYMTGFHQPLPIIQSSRKKSTSQVSSRASSPRPPTRSPSNDDQIVVEAQVQTQTQTEVEEVIEEQVPQPPSPHRKHKTRKAHPPQTKYQLFSYGWAKHQSLYPLIPLRDSLFHYLNLLLCHVIPEQVIELMITQQEVYDQESSVTSETTMALRFVVQFLLEKHGSIMINTAQKIIALQGNTCVTTLLIPHEMIPSWEFDHLTHTRRRVMIPPPCPNISVEKLKDHNAFFAHERCRANWKSYVISLIHILYTRSANLDQYHQRGKHKLSQLFASPLFDKNLVESILAHL